MNKTDRRKIYFGAIIVAVSILLIISLWDYVPAALSGIVLAYLFYPVFKLLNKHIKNDYLSSGITVLLAALVVILPFIFISGTFIVQSSEVISYVEQTDIIGSIESFIERYPLPEQVQSYLESESFENSLEELAKTSFSYLSRGLRSAAGYVSNLLITIFVGLSVMFFTLIDRGNFMHLIESLLPLTKKGSDRLEKKGKNVIDTVVYGLGVVAVIQGLIGGIGFYIFGLEGAVVWGFVMMIFSLIPVLGAFLVWLPASLYLFFSGETGSGIGLFLYGSIIVSYVDNIARMKVFHSIGRIHPLVTLFGILFGLPVFGIFGLIIGPLILALFVTMLEIAHEEIYKD